MLSPPDSHCRTSSRGSGDSRDVSAGQGPVWAEGAPVVPVSSSSSSGEDRVGKKSGGEERGVGAATRAAAAAAGRLTRAKSLMERLPLAKRQAVQRGKRDENIIFCVGGGEADERRRHGGRIESGLAFFRLRKARYGTGIFGGRLPCSLD